MAISLKTPKEIESMRKAGKILGEILETLANDVHPGITTWDLEKKAEKLFEQYNVRPGFKGYHGYPAILCTSVNEHVVHAIPSRTIRLNEGDILSIDCGVIIDGLNTDSAVAVVVGKAKPEVQKFVDTCIKALWAGIQQVKPGNRIGDIGNAVEQLVRKAGYKVIPDLTGHGIGYQLHEEPYIPNYGKRGSGPALKPGMTIAIEPIISMGGTKIDTLDDDWTLVTRDGSLAIQHEHTLLVTETGYEVLSLRPNEKHEVGL